MSFYAQINLNEINKFLLEVVPKCGNIVRDAFFKEKNTQEKQTEADLVTETDKHVEILFQTVIKEKYPDHHFIGEETSNSKIQFDDRPVWIIDPVDGTSNFVHTFPFCCVSIAFCVNKIPQIGVVYNAVTDQLFSAVKGQGAFLNGKTLNSSKQTSLEKSLVLTEFGNNRDAEKLKLTVDNMHRIISKCHGIRCMGSAALNICHVASGAADVYFEFGIHIWDIAAGYLIAKEAGCVVCEPMEGKELDLQSRRVLVASTDTLAQQIIPLINEISYERD